MSSLKLVQLTHPMYRSYSLRVGNSTSISFTEHQAHDLYEQLRGYLEPKGTR